MKDLKALFWGAMTLFCIASNLSAQYYSKSYHDTRLDYAYFGEVVLFTDRGNLMSGVTTFGPPINNRQAKIERTDPAGALTFGNNYSISNSGVRQDIESAFASEVRNSVTGFAGSFREAGSGTNDVYYARLDASGAALSATAYNCAGYNNYSVNGIYNDTIYDQFLILGSLETTVVPIQRIGFIISVDPQTSVINWSHTYDFAFSVTNPPCTLQDAVLIPSTLELAVVGNAGHTGTRDGVVLLLDPLTGLPTGSSYIAVNIGSDVDDVLNSITYFDNSSSRGLACSGFSDLNGDYDAWAVIGDFTMTPSSITSNLYDNAGTKNDNRAYSIVDRTDTGGNTTFFLGGNATVVPFGPFQNVDIYKLDATLGLTANFMEGDNLHNDYVVQLGQYDGSGSSPDPGLVSFGTKFKISTGNADHHLNKFYFSGHIPCVTQLISSVKTSGPTANTIDYVVDDNFSDFGLTLTLESSFTENVICDGTDGSGSNAKTAPHLSFTTATGSKGHLSITLENEGDKAMPAEIIVTDLLGRVWLRKTLEAAAGTQTIELPMNLQDQASGIYLITLRTEQEQMTKKLFLD